MNDVKHLVGRSVIFRGIDRRGDSDGQYFGSAWVNRSSGLQFVESNSVVVVPLGSVPQTEVEVFHTFITRALDWVGKLEHVDKQFECGAHLNRKILRLIRHAVLIDVRQVNGILSSQPVPHSQRPLGKMLVKRQTPFLLRQYRRRKNERKKYRTEGRHDC